MYAQAVWLRKYSNWDYFKFGELAETFQHHLESIASQQFNSMHQTAKRRELKGKWQENNLVLHVDFSENDGCKLNAEIQSFHFGGNINQVTIHTVVAYTKMAIQSFATVSKSLRHDECAWKCSITHSLSQSTLSVMVLWHSITIREIISYWVLCHLPGGSSVSLGITVNGAMENELLMGLELGWSRWQIWFIKCIEE